MTDLQVIDLINGAAVASAFAILGLGLVGGLMRKEGDAGVAPLALFTSLVMLLWGLSIVGSSLQLTDANAVRWFAAIRILGWLVLLLAIARLGHLPMAVTGGCVGIGAALGLVFAMISSFDRLTSLHGAFLVAGVLLAAALWQANESERFFVLKWLLAAVAMVFLPDLLILTFDRFSDAPAAPQALLNAIAAPLLAVALARTPHWAPRIFISRQVAYAGLIGLIAGLTVILMVVAARLLSHLGEPWQSWIVFSLAGVVILGIVLALSSGSFRAKAADLIDRHFFTNRYDYRIAWQSYVDGVDVDRSQMGSDGDLSARLVGSVAEVMGSTGGAIYLKDDRDHFELLARQNFPGTLAEEMEGAALAVALTEAPAIIEPVLMNDVDHWTRSLPPPPATWLIIPLRRHGRLLGVLLLSEARNPRPLSEEDRVLIRLLADQTASYLAEDQALRALMDAQAFESFNRRFAFVLHDVKNIAHELSLTLENARRFRDNPRFYDSLLRALERMEERMGGLMAGVRRSSMINPNSVEISDLIKSVVRETNDTRLVLDCDGPVRAMVEPLKLGAVLRHVIDNAREASDGDAPIKVLLRSEAEQLTISIQDQGHGMSSQFMRDHLFRPFATTKTQGMGIGLVQARSTIEAMDGQLKIKSEDRVGTTVTISLPIGDDGS